MFYGFTFFQLPDKPAFIPPPSLLPATAVKTADLPSIPTSANASPPPAVNQLLQNLSNSKQTADQPPGSPPNTQVLCTLCGWNFDNENFLQLHMVLMHSKKSQNGLTRRLKGVVDEYKCRECDCNFTVYEDFVSHLKQVHNDHRFVCHICAKIFKLRGSLLVHLRVVHNPIGKLCI